MADSELLDRLHDWATRELEALWDNLIREVRLTLNGDWSIHCDALGRRIKQASELVGPVDWSTIPIPQLLPQNQYDGRFESWFAATSRRIGVEKAKLPNDEAIAEMTETWKTFIVGSDIDRGHQRPGRRFGHV